MRPGPEPRRRAIARLLACALAADAFTLACTPAKGGGNPVTPQATRRPGPKPSVAGSARPGEPTPRPGATPTPASPLPPGVADAIAKAIAGRPTRALAPDATLAAARLQGQVRLISDKGGGIISDNGGGIISDNGGGILSNNGGSIISDNGGGLVTENGSAWRLLQAAGPTEWKLADAVLLVEDAAGRVLLGPDGRPIAAFSDRQGGYTLDARLPAENLVLRAPLWQGGKLSAMLAKDALGAGGAVGAPVPLDLDTSSSIAASYVLGRFVAPQADKQATYDRLPAREAERLERELDAARGLVTAPPAYADDELAGLGDAIRAKAPAVDRVLEDIKALLIGQARIGSGRPATDVALFDVWSLAADAAGRMYVGEHALGRIRLVDGAGTLTTELDAAFGRVKENVPGLSAIVPIPGGGYYATGWALGEVRKYAADGQRTVVAGVGVIGRGPVDVAATAAQMVPQSLALGADGTLYIGEGHIKDALVDAESPPRVLAVEPGGQLRQLPFGTDWTNGRLGGVGVAPDGALWALYHRFRGDAGELWRLEKGATAAVKVASGLGTDSRAGLGVGPDGRAYVCETATREVTAIAPDGKAEAIAGAGAPAGAPALQAPATAAFKPDGTLLVADVGTTLVHARAPGGAWSVVAGTTKLFQRGAADAFALNFPGSVTFDDAGRMLVTETGGHKIRRLAGDTLETVAGAFAGLAGDGGPAQDARFDAPLWIRWHEGELWVMDQANRRLRKIDAGGTVSTVVGLSGERGRNIITADKPRPPERVEVRWGSGVAFAPGGQAYWASQFSNQVVRLRTTGRVPRVELVAGEPRPEKEDIPGPSAWLAPVPASGPAATTSLLMPTGLAFDPTAAEPTLYVADTGHMRIVKITGLDGDAPVAETVAGLPALAALSKTPEQVNAESGIKALDATIAAPAGLCFDAAGNLYVGELGIRDFPRLAATFSRPFPKVEGVPDFTARIRKIAKDGTITTIAGPGGKFYPDPSSDEALVLPIDLAIDPQGRLVIVDAGANLIRILPAGSF